jgi:hypothetical protein
LVALEGDHIMPEYTYEDRCVIMAEQSMWTVVEILKAESNTDHGFTKAIKAVLDAALNVAQQLGQYNDQFETVEEWDQ